MAPGLLRTNPTPIYVVVGINLGLSMLTFNLLGILIGLYLLYQTRRLHRELTLEASKPDDFTKS